MLLKSDFFEMTALENGTTVLVTFIITDHDFQKSYTSVLLARLKSKEFPLVRDTTLIGNRIYLRVRCHDFSQHLVTALFNEFLECEIKSLLKLNQTC